jgi:CRISPR-associated protein Csx10
MNIEYRLKFLSDWHIGSGSGIPGVVDNGILKDNRNIPIVTGKTVKGIARDALEDILAIIATPTATDVVEYIFGGEGDKEANSTFFTPSLQKDTGYGGMQVDDAFDGFLDFFSHQDVGDIRHHTSIDKETGTAEEHHLFSEETADQLFVFDGEIQVDDDHAKYILAALRFITKIGGKRRRGLGQCEFEIVEPKPFDSYIRELFK